MPSVIRPSPKTLNLLAEYCAAQKPHSGNTLLSHLLGTFELLNTWGSSRDACYAGLFHGVYGTEKYLPQTIPLSHRVGVRKAIGEAAEGLVYLFCVSEHRPFFMTLTAEHPTIHDRLFDEQLAITGEQVRNLIEIEVANWVEQLPRYSMHFDELERFAAGIEASKNFMTPRAYRAILEALLEKYRDRPTLRRRAGHALVNSVSLFRRTLAAARRMS